MPLLHLLAILYPHEKQQQAGWDMVRLSRYVSTLVLVTGLVIIGIANSHAQPLLFGQTVVNNTEQYSTYQVIDDGSFQPGMGIRYSVEQNWFIFGEARHANQVPLTQEPRLFQPEEPRTILIGGGIYF